MVLQPSYLSRHSATPAVSPVMELLATRDKHGKGRNADVQGSRSTGLDVYPKRCERNRRHEELQANMKWCYMMRSLIMA